MNITATDKSALLRLAGSLSKGDAMRRAILSGLRRVAADDKKPAKAPAHLSPFLGKHKKLFEDFLSKADLNPQDLANEGSATNDGYGKWSGQLPPAIEEFGAEHPEEADAVMIAWASKKTGIPKAKLQDPDVFSNGSRGFEIDPKAARK